MAQINFPYTRNPEVTQDDLLSVLGDMYRGPSSVPPSDGEIFRDGTRMRRQYARGGPVESDLLKPFRIGKAGSPWQARLPTVQEVEAYWNQPNFERKFPVASTNPFEPIRADYGREFAYRNGELLERGEMGLGPLSPEAAANREATGRTGPKPEGTVNYNEARKARVRTETGWGIPDKEWRATVGRNPNSFAETMKGEFGEEFSGGASQKKSLLSRASRLLPGRKVAKAAATTAAAAALVSQLEGITAAAKKLLSGEEKQAGVESTVKKADKK